MSQDSKSASVETQHQSNGENSTKKTVLKLVDSGLPVSPLAGIATQATPEHELTAGIFADHENAVDEWNTIPDRSEAGPGCVLSPCGEMISQLAPSMSITGASSSISTMANLSQEIQSGGLDTLVCRCFGSWDAEKWDETLANFIDAQDTAVLNGYAVELESTFATAVGVMMLPFSITKPHEGVYQWHLQFDGCNLLIRNKMEEHERLPSLIVEIGSLAMMQLGHVEAWKMVVRFLADLGFVMSKAVPSRADPCVDVVGLTMKKIIDAHNERRVIRLARDGAAHFSGLKDTGYELGKGAIKMRAYDKLQELSDKPGPASDLKREVLEKQRWNGKPDDATRIEFQIRRDALREVFEIDTVEQLFEQLPNVVKYLCEKWVRFTSTPVDRENKNQTRAEVAEWWLAVRDAFLQWTGQATQPKFEREKKPLMVRQLGLQALGCLESFGAALGVQADNFADLVWYVAEQLEAIQLKRDEQAEKRGAKTIHQRIELKRSKLAARLATMLPVMMPEVVPF